MQNEIAEADKTGVVAVFTSRTLAGKYKKKKQPFAGLLSGSSQKFIWCLFLFYVATTSVVQQCQLGFAVIYNPLGSHLIVSPFPKRLKFFHE